MALASSKQIGAIHTLAAKAGMDEDTRRDFMEVHGGARSAKQLTNAGAIAVIDQLKQRTGNGAVAGLDSPVAGKLRALWIAGYDLGLVQDRTDRAMLAFLERQCGVSHTRFLSEPGQATAAIEALKSWLARAAGVVWPVSAAAARASKRAVIEAQLRLLANVNALPPCFSTDNDALNALSPGECDALQKKLGTMVRKAKPAVTQ